MSENANKGEKSAALQSLDFEQPALPFELLRQEREQEQLEVFPGWLYLKLQGGSPASTHSMEPLSYQGCRILFGVTMCKTSLAFGTRVSFRTFLAGRHKAASGLAFFPRGLGPTFKSSFAKRFASRRYFSDSSFNIPPSAEFVARPVGICSMLKLPVRASAEGLDAAFIGVPQDTGTSNRPGAR